MLIGLLAHVRASATMAGKKRPSKKLLLGRPVWFWVGAAAAVAALALLVNTDTFSDAVESVTHWAQGVMAEHPVAGAAVFFLLSIVSAMLGFASSAVLVPPANEVWGKPVTLLLLWGGWMAGAAIAYWIGAAASPLLAKLGAAKQLDALREFVSKRTRFWVLVLFCLAVPTELASYLLGSIHHPFVRFAAAMGISEAVYAAGMIIAGESLLEAESTPLLIAGAVLLAIAIGAGVLITRLKKKGKGKTR
jgi:uncharacterized membrane protein YdjX (TVP38/TMEM64 family)